MTMSHPAPSYVIPWRPVFLLTCLSPYQTTLQGKGWVLCPAISWVPSTGLGKKIEFKIFTEWTNDSTVRIRSWLNYSPTESSRMDPDMDEGHSCCNTGRYLIQYPLRMTAEDKSCSDVQSMQSWEGEPVYWDMAKGEVIRDCSCGESGLRPWLWNISVIVGAQDSWKVWGRRCGSR